MTKARLYGRAGCHLCEQMARTLRAFGVAFEELDVDSDERLRARYGERVPVLTDAAGNELCHGRLDPAVLERVR
ncbi:MAG: glutaredoxin family protein [Betaproteobacteria bacterium]|nr:MAG: glutaredoxin family protein [Betaproteobacteria bacterium]